MRYYLAATLIPALFLAAIGKVIAQSPEPQTVGRREADGAVPA